MIDLVSGTDGSLKTEFTNETLCAIYKKERKKNDIGLGTLVLMYRHSTFSSLTKHPLIIIYTINNGTKVYSE